MEIFGLGAPELILILIVVLLLFGKDKLPELARSIGTSFKELKSGFNSSADSGAASVNNSTDKKAAQDASGKPKK